MELASDWGVDRRLWMREWATLSGGEGQRLALAIALGIGGAEVVLLDGKWPPSGKSWGMEVVYGLDWGL